ncbi:histone deacetylase [uncultured Marivirga sp.]|uniref:histone deacetylase family protein n=1 Tax=uncultured Marivirga sp. TaxID=1123707 RepID=UPI0030EE5360|tara:strand:- start:222411 stop:223313 length:903 start_codon:yes stop_codon:yes gene_type:complete
MLKIAWRKEYTHPLPDNHRFPMEKYDLLPEQLIYEGTVSSSNFFAPELLSEEDILSVHKNEYWQKLKNLMLSRKEERRTGFPLSAALVERERIINQGTIDAANFALKYGAAMNIAGGTHHAFTDRGEGFCLLNDIAIAANYLLKNKKSEKVLIVDLDVHQGNGTAEIFKNNPKVFTFSMHGKGNYPMHKENSDLDIELEDKTDDKTYLKILREVLPRLIQEQEPDFIFFQSGVDVLATDKLGRLGMSIAGCKERDKIVFEHCYKNEIPVVASMGGGYSEKIAHIIDAHANTYRLAQDIYF